MSAAPTLNSSCQRWTLRGIATTFGRLISQASGDLRWLGADVRRNVAQRSAAVGSIRPQSLAAEQLVHRPNPTGPVGEAVLAAQQSLRRGL